MDSKSICDDRLQNILLALSQCKMVGTYLSYHCGFTYIGTKVGIFNLCVKYVLTYFP